jgi:predicted RNase H-like HicB family nuclease
MNDFYPIVVVAMLPSDGIGYIGYVPDLRGCMSHGETPEEALSSARRATRDWIEEAKEQGWTLPSACQTLHDLLVK